MSRALALTASLALLAALYATGTEPDTLPQPLLAIDGDTIRVPDGQPNIRLARIDAPELPGHCRRGRQCAPGNPWASQHALQALLDRGCPCTFTPASTRDAYGRRLGELVGREGNISNLMLASGLAAQYKP